MKKTVRFSLAISALATVLLSTACEEKKAQTSPPPQAQVPTVQAQATVPVSQPQVAASAPKQSPKADPVDALLKNVQREYEAGQANYKAGHLDAARDNFDKAVGMLMSGSVDIRSDQRMQTQFDQVTEGIRQLEM